MTVLDNSSNNGLDSVLGSQRSDYEDPVEYDHPDLPVEITLRKKTIRKRLDLFDEIVANQTEIRNEKELRCELFFNGGYGDPPLSFQENTNKENLILQHVRKFENQFRIAYKDEK